MEIDGAIQIWDIWVRSCSVSSNSQAWLALRHLTRFDRVLSALSIAEIIWPYPGPLQPAMLRRQQERRQRRFPCSLRRLALLYQRTSK
jgi:hypothetical protein